MINRIAYYTLRRFLPQGLWACCLTAVLAVTTAMTAKAEEQVTQRKTQEIIQVDSLQGTLLQVKKTGTVRIGYREASIPFSYLDGSNTPIGYSIDICKAIVDEIGRTVDRSDLHIDYVKVTADERLSALVEGRIDLECGSTTANAERREQVDFSPMIFVTGTKVLVARQIRWKDFRFLTHKTIGVGKGTTNEKALQDLDQKFNLTMKIVSLSDHEAGYEALSTGKIDVYASDEVLLYGLITKHEALDKFKVAGELLSYEPYGIAFRRDDPQLRDAVYRTFKNLVTNREFTPLYDKWFMRALPNGQQLKIPMSPQLEETLDALDSNSEAD